MSRSARTLLEPGHEAEWAAINREEAAQLRASNLALSPASSASSRARGFRSKPYRFWSLP